MLTVAVFGFFCVNWALKGIIHKRGVRTVPDIKNISLAAALDKLSPLNLGMKKEGSEFNSSVPVSAILRQNPPAGTKVREGKIVRVVLSEGGETVFVPSIAGMPLRNASMHLRQSQLTLGEVSEAFSLRLEKGYVLSQDPKAEKSVERSSLVNAVISAGKPPEGVVLMPDLLRKDVEDASAWAGEAGVGIQVSTDATSLFPYGVILTQEPPPDSVISSDSKVVIVISGREGDEGDSPDRSSRRFRYELSQGGSESLVRIVLADKYGERELFNGLRRPGSKIDIPIRQKGGARIKIYLNGILVEERDL